MPAGPAQEPLPSSAWRPYRRSRVGRVGRRTTLRWSRCPAVPPAPDWSEELAFLALVAGCGAESRPLPARVMGLWPDAGIHRIVELDEGDAGGSIDRLLERWPPW